MPDPVAKLLAKTASSLRQEWEDFVGVAYHLLPEAVDDCAASISKASKVGVDSIRRRLYGIQKAKSLGYSQEEICAFGQEKVLSMAQRENRAERYTDIVNLVFKVKGSQRELIQEQVARVRRLCRLATVEDYWDWWLGQMMTASDEQIRESGQLRHTARAKDAPRKD